MNKPDVIKVDPYPQYRGMSSEVDPYPGTLKELESYCDEIKLEKKKLSSRDISHHDISTYSKWRYYQR